MAELVIPRTVDDYLIALPEEQRNLLQQLREAITGAAPQAEELISYRIPTYRYKGALVHFAAFKNHCSFIVVDKGIIEIFKTELKGFKTSGTTIHFAADNPLPSSLVKKIVKARVKKNSTLK
jgi:uncharacterized protein YdhG (YjbR/CyaY superfamily)